MSFILFSFQAILLGIGLQNKTLDKLADEFNMPASQVLVKFYDCVKKLTHKIMGTMETTIGDNIIPASDTKYATEHFVPVEQSLHEELVAEDKVILFYLQLLSCNNIINCL